MPRTRIRQTAQVLTLALAALVPISAAAQPPDPAPAAPSQVQLPDPNPTRLFFGPTGRSVKKGEGYVGVYGLFLPFVQVGITDRISIGGEKRGGRRVKLLTENYVFNDGGILSAGIHFLGESLLADLGLFAPISGLDAFIALPIANFVWKF